MDKYSEENIRALSAEIYEQLSDLSSPTSHKTAEADLTNFIRIRVLEGSFRSRFLTDKPLKEDELVPQTHNDEPVVYVALEPDSPGAVQVDYASTPDEMYFFGKVVPLTVQQYQTPKVRKQLVQLMTYRYDIRQVIGDNMTKKLIARRDHLFMRHVNTITKARNAVNQFSGRPMWLGTVSPITYESYLDARKILDDAPFNLPNAKVLLSHHSILEFKKTIVNEFRGTDFANNVVTQGWDAQEFDKLQFVSTIKQNLVPHNSLFFFPEEQFLGAVRVLAEPSMVVEREGQNVAFYEYMIEGMLIAHAASVARMDFLT